MAILESPTQPTHLVEVDENGNLQVNLPASSAQAGKAKMLDASGDDLDVTENNALRVSLSNVILCDQVDGAAVNTNVWNQSTSSMTIAVVNGFITLNSGSAVTASAYAILSSIKYIPLYGTLPLRVTINAKVTNIPEANATAEIGIGSVATNAAPADGAFFRWGPAGQLFCVINNGGSESSSAALSGSIEDDDGDSVAMPPSQSVIHLFEIEVVEDKVIFYVDDINVSVLDVPSGQNYPFNAGRQQIISRIYNGGSSPAASPQIAIGQVNVVQQDLNKIKPWPHVLASLGKGAFQSPVTTFAQTANHANSTSPVSATLSNTTAGYATLGGRYQFAAVAGGATDYILFAYQVPTGYQLYVNDVSISCMNTGAIGGLTGTILDWAIGINSSAVSLATADGAGTWAPRRIPLGMQSFVISAAIGATVSDINRRLETPLVIDSGRYFHVILQIPVGLATASQIFRGDVFVNGYFE